MAQRAMNKAVDAYFKMHKIVNNRLFYNQIAELEYDGCERLASLFLGEIALFGSALKTK
jgi:hypothetical protein